MKAAWYERNGPASEVLTVGEMETPVPQRGEVRVKLATSGVNPSDVKSRRGRPVTEARIIPHSDGAGVIDALGEGTKAQIGDRVWIWNGQWNRPLGTAAEFICVSEEQAVRLPDGTDFAAGACLGIPALTAAHALRTFGALDGKTLLVTGAGSSVGHYASQIAKARGARIIGTASAERADLARDGGADVVIDYRSQDVAGLVKEATAGRGVDGIIDMDLSSTAPLLANGVLAPHGTIVVYGSNIGGDIPMPFLPLLFNNQTVKFILVYELTPGQRRTAISDVTSLLDANVLKHPIGLRLPLHEIVKAHEAVEGGKVLGNVVLNLP